MILIISSSGTITIYFGSNTCLFIADISALLILPIVLGLLLINFPFIQPVISNLSFIYDLLFCFLKCSSYDLYPNSSAMIHIFSYAGTSPTKTMVNLLLAF